MCDGVCFGAVDVGIGRLRAHMSIAGCLAGWIWVHGLAAGVC
jgi:hypothetical protein